MVNARLTGVIKVEGTKYTYRPARNMYIHFSTRAKLCSLRRSTYPAGIYRVHNRYAEQGVPYMGTEDTPGSES